MVQRLTNLRKTIGEQLETIDKQKTRAAETKDLIQYFLEFNKGIFTRLDTLRQSEPDGGYKVWWVSNILNRWRNVQSTHHNYINNMGLNQAAIIARRLNTIAKEVDIADTEAVSLMLIYTLGGFAFYTDLDLEI